MSTAIIFLLVLTVLVFVHELGHFLAARLFKIRVDEFAIGFPPRIISWMWGKTRYAINILPLGGYVRIYGENPDDVRTPDSILSKPRWQQTTVLVAGVTFNIIFAWILLSCSFMLGTRASVEAMPPQLMHNPALTIVLVSPGSPAQKAGLSDGDEIISMSNGKVLLATSTLSIASVQNAIATSPNTVSITVRHFMNGSDTSTDGSGGVEGKDYTVEAFTIKPVTGIVSGKKALGISMDVLANERASFFQSFYYGGRQTYYLTENVAVGLYQFLGSALVGKASLSAVSGPVGIAVDVGQSARAGLSSLLVIAAVISANLAVINLVPFPALDGGRVVIVAIEAVIRRDINSKIVQWINGLGFILLITLMIVITAKDIYTLFM